MAEYFESRMLTGEGDERLTDLLGRHFVSLHAIAEKDGAAPQRLMFSAFLVSVKQQWLVFTAGHNIDGLVKREAEGWRISHFEANDRFAGGEYRRAVPLGLSHSDFAFAYDEASRIDIAMAPLPALMCAAMAANKVVPIDGVRDLLALSGEPFSDMILAGVPEESAEWSGQAVTQCLAAVPISPVAACDVAESLRVAGDYRIYGSIPSEYFARFKSVVGTSGGPLFGIWYTPDREHFQYTVVAIQSGWSESSGQIAAWKIDYVLDHFAGLQDQN